MTDPNDLDELASAHLDGHTTPEEAARVAADPELLERVEELRAVREALAQVPTVDPVQRDAAVAAALAAFDEEDPADPSMAPVTALASRRRLSPRAVRAVGVAAVVLLIALLVPLLATIDRDDDTASFNATGDALESGDDGAEDAPALDAGATTSAAPEAGALDGALGLDLGAFEDFEELAAAVEARHIEERSATAFSDDAAAQQLCSTDAGVIAVVAGRAVRVFVRTAPDGTRTMVVLDHDTCERLAEREI